MQPSEAPVMMGAEGVGWHCLNWDKDSYEICACVLQNLDQWTMRQSSLELQLMIKQTANNVSFYSEVLYGNVWCQCGSGCLCGDGKVTWQKWEQGESRQRGSWVCGSQVWEGCNESETWREAAVGKLANRVCTELCWNVQACLWVLSERTYLLFLFSRRWTPC